MTPDFTNDSGLPESPENRHAGGPEGIVASTPQDLVIADPRNRRLAQPLDQPLPVTMKWIASLPREVRPLALLRQYPRLANALCRAWSDTSLFRAQLDDLLVDRRGRRRGFPLEVQAELLGLREHFEGRYPHSPSAR